MKREEKWIYAVTAGVCVASMQAGMGLLQPDSSAAVWLGVAQGFLVCVLTLLCGSIIEWLLADPPEPEEQEPRLLSHPMRERILECEMAFETLAGSFQTVETTETEEGNGALNRAERLWNMRMAENREAVSLQLREMAHIMGNTAESMWNMKADHEMQEILKRRLRSMGLQVYHVLVYEPEQQLREVYLTLSTKGRQCVAVRDVAEAVSRILGRGMMPARDSRTFVGRERVTVLFVERTCFEVLYGVKKAVKREEQISGDNFSVYTRREGRLLASLSDGMGSGMQAFRESEQVIDLLEQFLEAGFSRETAVRMINSALLVRSDARSFSTLDICTINLYSGVCEFLKVGAAASFIRREHQVETIASASLPAGVLQKPDLEVLSRKLYDGDMVIMVTDGVLEALPAGCQEEVMENMILECGTDSPQEMADYILKQAMEYEERRPADDMTILVLNLCKR